MKGINKRCFVCEIEVSKVNSELNLDVYLQVCESCKGSDAEKKKVNELLNSLADGLVCGCI